MGKVIRAYKSGYIGGEILPRPHIYSSKYIGDFRYTFKNSMLVGCHSKTYGFKLHINSWYEFWK